MLVIPAEALNARPVLSGSVAKFNFATRSDVLLPSVVPDVVRRRVPSTPVLTTRPIGDPERIGATVKSVSYAIYYYLFIMTLFFDTI